MELEEFQKNIIKEAKKLNIELTKQQSEQFYKYTTMLLDWNTRINLTSITEIQDVITKHFIDSLTILKYIKEEDKVIDVGTGAGFPGLPIKIVKPKIEVTLLDSLNKRVKFLNETIKEIETKNITTIHLRAEDAGRLQEHREQYNVVVSRAVAPMNTLLEYMMPFAKVNGICICMKGSKADEEINKSNKAISKLGGKIEKIETFQLPETDINRTIIIVKKIKEITDEYPRKAGIPNQKPL